ncbi:phage tail tape measure protein [Microbacterium sp. 22195]|uniref:phage tail tape measure protein n=1 Tax=Microbacterium sp. 22195 TaxID=3453891 RepID=UPI003F85E4B3
MTDRITRVVLEAEIANFEENMRRASNATKKAADEGDRLAQTHQAMSEVGRASLVMGAAVAAGVGVAVAKFADFDQAMSNVAATGQDARDNISELRDAAIDAGAKTVFSAQESANAIEEMAKAGVDAKDILGGGLSGALDLAAAGGLGVADAAGIAATALKTFKLEGSDMSHVADLLAAGAGKAMGDVSDLSMALKQGGQAAALTGLSIEETTASLSAFAAQGLLGSDAGTSLKTMLLSLNPTTEQAATLMDELNLRAFDQQGKFIGVAEYAGKLKNALGDMSAEQQSATLKTIFGTDAYRAAAVMLDEGEKGMRKWISAVDDSGYASETAATRLDNLKGDIEQFGGALDSAFISMGEGVNGPLRDLFQGLTSLVDGFNALPEPMKQGVLWVGLVTAGVALLGGAALVAIPKIASFKVALQTLNITASTARAGLSRFASFLGGPWAIATVAATTAVTLLKAGLDNAQASAGEMTNSLVTAKDAADIWKTAMKGEELKNFNSLRRDLGDLDEILRTAARQATNWWERIGNSSNFAAEDALRKIGDQLGELAGSDLPAAQRAFNLLAAETDGTEEQLWNLVQFMPGYRDALIEQANSLKITADKSNLLKLASGELGGKTEESAEVAKTAGDAYLEEADSAKRLTDQISKLIEQINEANGIGQDAITANARYQEALAGLKDQVEQTGTSLDQSTQKGAANAAGLADLAAAAQDAAKAQYEQDQTTMSADESTQKYIETLTAQRQAFIDSAVKAGYNREAVERLADQVFKLPSKKEIDILAKTAEAQNKLDYWIKSNNGREIHVKVKADGSGFSYGGRQVTPGLANGGIFHNKEKAFADSGFEPGIYKYTPGGIHKFAEEYDEAYISGDPRRRARSEQVWLRAGREFGFQQPQVNVAAPSLDGMRISGTLDLGNGLTGMIRGVVSEAFPSAESVRSDLPFG